MSSHGHEETRRPAPVACLCAANGNALPLDCPQKPAALTREACKLIKFTNRPVSKRARFEKVCDSKLESDLVLKRAWCTEDPRSVIRAVRSSYQRGYQGFKRRFLRGRQISKRGRKTAKKQERGLSHRSTTSPETV